MNNLARRNMVNKVVMVVSVVCAAGVILVLVSILFTVLKNGVGAINWDLFTKDPIPPVFKQRGGLRNAFLGQGLLTLAAVIVGVPIGICGGTFIAEYGRHSKAVKAVSIASDILTSVPSIVVATFVYAIMVRPFGSFNGWAGAAALAIIMLPVVLRTTEDTISLVPWELREAAFALGAPYYKVIIQIVYRSAFSGIFTGILLAVARVSGETAPLLFTSFNSSFLQLDMKGPMPSLTVSIYQYAASPYESWVSMAWAAAFVITCFVLVLNIAGRVIAKIK